MATAAGHFQHEIEIEDVEYLRHGDALFLARLFKPRGQGPFPAIVELHGGAWCLGDRLNDDGINQQLARNGILVGALDFRDLSHRMHRIALLKGTYSRKFGDVSLVVT